MHLFLGDRQNLIRKVSIVWWSVLRIIFRQDYCMLQYFLQCQLVSVLFPFISGKKSGENGTWKSHKSNPIWLGIFHLQLRWLKHNSQTHSWKKIQVTLRCCSGLKNGLRGLQSSSRTLFQKICGLLFNIKWIIQEKNRKRWINILAAMLSDQIKELL